MLHCKLQQIMQPEILMKLVLRPPSLLLELELLYQAFSVSNLKCGIYVGKQSRKLDRSVSSCTPFTKKQLLYCVHCCNDDVVLQVLFQLLSTFVLKGLSLVAAKALHNGMLAKLLRCLWLASLLNKPLQQR